jgi:coenzyme F420-reducing hydrogenase beta subunit/polysaccharide pyruvyl transferase WcaK-like protein
MNNNIVCSTNKYNNCIGCGICDVVCPRGAIEIRWTRYREILPVIDYEKCIRCGICVQYCPNTKEKIEFEAKKITSSDDPNSFGLQDSTYLLAHDKDKENRKRSASGGFISSFIRHLFDKKIIDGVVHARMLEGKIGGIHYEASISMNYEESDKKRSSFYGPICYTNIIKSLSARNGRYLVIGVPCAIRALTNLFNKHETYKNNKIYTIALACSHNVNGQFVDFLAESLNIDKKEVFKVNLRNKDDIKDANNYNNHFFNEERDFAKTNRFQSVFTDTWRNHFFAMNACHYCSDFWGYTADISVKDAWGKWASNPLGDSIVVVRNTFLLEEILSSKYMEYEYLDFDTVSKCQLSTTKYKQYEVKDRLNLSCCNVKNLRSGFYKYYIFSKFSKWCYRNLGYNVSKIILFTLLWIINIFEMFFIKKRNSDLDYCEMQLESVVNKMRDKNVIFFGTGKMSRVLTKNLPIEILYYLDNDKKKQDKEFCDSIIKRPDSILNENKENIFIVVSSMYYDEISQQLKNMGLSEYRHFIDGLPIYGNILKYHEIKKQISIKYRLMKFFYWLMKPIKSVVEKFKRLYIYKKNKKYKKILVVGGYGFRNTGDEAQLSATLDILHNEFPQYLIKVLTPNKEYTYFEHGKCLVGDAPRTAFYDLGETTLYSLNSRWDKIKFIIISFWIYLNAFLVRAGLPTFLINSKKSTLLYEISTSDMVYFSGGGYLTGKTLSRLWDGMFLIRIADVFKVPSVLSGQTIGVWQNNFNKKLGKWALSKAKLITLRDPIESITALKEIDIEGQHVFTTFDDALFCEKIKEVQVIDDILSCSGMSNKQILEGYICLNIHYWGLNTESQKQELLQKISTIANYILCNTKLNILLIPMTPSDEETIKDYMSKYKNNRLFSLVYDYNFRVIRSVIARSEACVTMKHHPIIFAIGEKVPVISLALSDYYEHKNIGALKVFGLEKYNVLINKESFYEDFKNLFQDIIKEKSKVMRNIDEKFMELKRKKEYFSQLVDDLLK